MSDLTYTWALKVEVVDEHGQIVTMSSQHMSGMGLPTEAERQELKAIAFEAFAKVQDVLVRKGQPQVFA